jgi:hypothetical protein
MPSCCISARYMSTIAYIPNFGHANGRIGLKPENFTEAVSFELTGHDWGARMESEEIFRVGKLASP